MLLQILPQRFPQNPHAAAVHHAHPGQPGEECAVDEFFYFAGGVIDGRSR
jgi:hypothetical protein